MLKDLMEKVDNIYEQMGNFSRGMETIKKDLNGNARNEKQDARQETFC